MFTLLVFQQKINFGAANAADETTSIQEASDGQFEIVLPRFWSPGQRPGKPVLEKIEQIRFLTSSDFPPFNFIDPRGDLVGFNVDLAREICHALDLPCTIRAETWVALASTMADGKGDAIIASLTLTPENRRRYDFTERYYTTPARFAARSDIGAPKMTPEGLTGQKVGVIRNTAHAAYLRDFFRHSDIVIFANREELRTALQDRKISFLFDDGISIMFWLGGLKADSCCVFVGGPYTESRYFGEGIAIAVTKGNDRLREALNYGLREVFKNGKFLEIFLRHFPHSFY